VRRRFFFKEVEGKVAEVEESEVATVAAVAGYLVTWGLFHFHFHFCNMTQRTVTATSYC
jgi:succinate-acetate transporter protein